MALTVEQGGKLAERHLGAKIAVSEFWRYRFELAYLWRETAAFWVFLKPSEELIDAGHAPGGVIAYVDKVDGHIWDDEAVIRYYAVEAQHREYRQMVA